MGIDVSVGNISSKVFDNFKKITPALFSLVILSGLLLFLPENILNKMALDELPNSVRMAIGIVFLLCSALTFTIVLFSSVETIYLSQKHKRFRKKQRQKYLKLSKEQKNILIQLLKSEDKSIQLNANSGDTIYLKTNMFIHQPEQICSVGYNNELFFTYVPEPWLLDLFNSNPELFN